MNEPKLKTVEEWKQEFGPPGLPSEIILAIQLNGIKYGMWLAATLVYPDGNPAIAIDRILTAAENMTEVPQ